MHISPSTPSHQSPSFKSQNKKKTTLISPIAQSDKATYESAFTAANEVIKTNKNLTIFFFFFSFFFILKNKQKSFFFPPSNKGNPHHTPLDSRVVGRPTDPAASPRTDRLLSLQDSLPCSQQSSLPRSLLATLHTTQPRFLPTVTFIINFKKALRK